MTTLPRSWGAAALTATLVFGGVACSDEDGDGATTDEEVGELDEEVDEGADKLEEEVDAGQDEAEDDS